MTNPDEAWRRVKQQVVPQQTAQDLACERMQRERDAERQALAAIQGVTIPVMPPREPGETDKAYGCRIAWIAKSYCGPPPRKTGPPKRLPKLPTPPTPPPGEDTAVCHGERLARMTPDPTTEEDP